jgi:hypothetical protein
LSLAGETFKKMLVWVSTKEGCRIGSNWELPSSVGATAREGLQVQRRLQHMQSCANGNGCEIECYSCISLESRKLKVASAFGRDYVAVPLICVHRSKWSTFARLEDPCCDDKDTSIS